MKTTKIMAGIATLGVAASVAGTAQAATNLVTNGSFESLTSGPGQLGFNTNATGWTTNGYNFVFAPGTADSTGSNGQYGNLQLWGPGNGSANGLTASSPDGGNYIGNDGAFQVGDIHQTINGLTVGHTYVVTFDWAAAQQSGYTGPTTDFWTVGLGNQSYNTSTYQLPTEGFSGWMNQSFSFTAANQSEVLSFLATGTPQGEPPFALLDGVKMYDTAVPEPSSLVAMFAGGLLLVAIIRRRVQSTKSMSKA
jgi:hypothetical protein